MDVAVLNVDRNYSVREHSSSGLVFVTKPNSKVSQGLRAVIRDISGTAPPSSGDWVIEDTTIVRDSRLIINGSIIVESTGTLVLVNSEIYMNLNEDGEYGIRVYGNLTVVNSVVTSLGSHRYYLVAYPESYVRIEGSKISYAGYEYIGEGVGLFFNSSTVIVTNSTIDNCLHGLYLFHVDGAIVENNVFLNSYYGIYMDTTNNTKIFNNTFAYDIIGILITGVSTNNNISSNIFNHNRNDGIVTGQDTTGNHIERNIFNGSPIFESGVGNYIEYNRFLNVNKGIQFWNAEKTIFRHNIFENSAVDYIESEDLIFENNTINGKPILYIYNESFAHIDQGDYGQIILDLVRSTRVTGIEMTNTYMGILVEGSEYLTIDRCTFINVSWPIKISYTSSAWVLENTIVNAYVGIDIYHSEFSLVKDNIVRNVEREGIHLATHSDASIVAHNWVYNAETGIRTFYSYNITIANNTVVSSDFGVKVVDSSLVYVYLNNFIDNLIHFDLDDSDYVHLYSKDTLKYSYRGQTFESYLGNYWSGFESVDSDGNGIWDEPYVADEYDNITDDYPLVSAVAIKDNQIVLTSKPTIRILAPEDGSYLNTTEITVVWNATDPDNDIDHFEIIVDGINIESDIPADANNYTFNATEGHHEITVIVVDETGNSANQTIAIVVDVTPPKILILSPHVGSIINSSTVEVRWSVTDNISGVDHLEIYVNGELADGNIPANQTKYVLTLTSGTHQILLKAYDKAGNVGEALTLVRVNVETKGGLSISTTSLIAVATIAIVIAVAVILLKRRSG